MKSIRTGILLSLLLGLVIGKESAAQGPPPPPPPPPPAPGFAATSITYDAVNKKITATGTADHLTQPALEHRWFRSWTGTWSPIVSASTSINDTWTVAYAGQSFQSGDFIVLQIWVSGQPLTAITNTYVHP